MLTYFITFALPKLQMDKITNCVVPFIYRFVRSVVRVLINALSSLLSAADGHSLHTCGICMSFCHLPPSFIRNRNRNSKCCSALSTTVRPIVHYNA